MKRIISMVLLPILVLFALSGCSGSGAQDSAAGVDAGVAYLKALEARDPAEVDAALKAIRRQNMLEQREEMLGKLQSGEISVWSLFEDYLIMGDSRAAGFEYLEILDNNRLLGLYGESTDEMPNHYQALRDLNPSYLFLSYGLNDMLLEGNETPEAFAEIYLTRLEALQAQCPQAKIFVNNIFPCTDPAFDSKPGREKWRENEAYNEAMEKVLRDTDFYYISNDNITDFSQYWVDDGIHFNRDFYQLWAANMIMAVYDVEMGLDKPESEEPDVPEEIKEP